MYDGRDNIWNAAFRALSQALALWVGLVLSVIEQLPVGAGLWCGARVYDGGGERAVGTEPTEGILRH